MKMTEVESKLGTLECKADLLKRLALIDKSLLDLDERIAAYQLPSFETRFCKLARNCIERMQFEVAELCELLG